MLWFVVIAILLTLCIVSIVVYNFAPIGKVDWLLGVGVASGLISSLLIVIVFVTFFTNRPFPSVFEQQKQFFANHKVTNELEDVTLTNKKIELNEKLFKFKYDRETYGLWSLAPKEVIDLTPIE